MDYRDSLDEDVERLLGRFDFATKLFALEQEHHQRLKSVLITFVEVMDSFERLFGADEQIELSTQEMCDWIRTCRLIRRQLMQSLNDAGVTQFISSGKIASPDLHEISGVETRSDCEEDTIIRELFHGYRWDGEILRKARVIIAQPDRNAKEK